MLLLLHVKFTHEFESAFGFYSVGYLVYSYVSAMLSYLAFSVECASFDVEMFSQLFLNIEYSLMKFRIASVFIT